MFRRSGRSSISRTSAPAALPSATVTDPLDAPVAPPFDPETLAVALQRADELWVPPRTGDVQHGVALVCGGRAPTALIGARLWPVRGKPGLAPALLLVDDFHRVHVVVDIPRPGRPAWVAASSVVHCPRMTGSHDLWRHWHGELSAHAPHEWTASCEDHEHLERPDVHGRYVSAIPRHDAWMMSRAWLPPEFVLASAADARWIVLSASDRTLREREPRVRSLWDSVAFGEAAVVLSDWLVDDPKRSAPSATLAALSAVLGPVPEAAHAEVACAVGSADVQGRSAFGEGRSMGETHSQ